MKVRETWRVHWLALKIGTGKTIESQGMALTPAGFSSSQSDKAKYQGCQKRQR